MNIRKSIQAILAVFALIFGSGMVSAQDSTPQALGPRQDTIETIIQAVADETGLDASQIMLQAFQGESLADIITANGGDVDTVIANIVTQLTADINQSLADGIITERRANRLLDRVEQMASCAVNGDLRGGRPIIRTQETLLQAASAATGMQPFDIMTEVRAGSTLAAVITAHGGSVDAAVNSAIATATSNINEAVGDGCLNEDQAENLSAGLQTLFTTMVNSNPLAAIAERRLGAGVIRLAAVTTRQRPEQIRREIQSGQTLAAILTANGVDVNTFIETAVAGVQRRLDIAVRLGRIQQSTEDQLLATFRQELTDFVNNTPMPEATAASQP